MTTNEILTLAISMLSLVVSVFALVQSSRASAQGNDIAAATLKLNHAQVEIDLRNQITDARRNVEDFFTTHGDFLAQSEGTAEASEKRARLKLAANSVTEGYLSALDAACQAFLDGKIDQVRFKKGYQRDIRQSVQEEAHKDFLRPGHAYNALMRVYEDWENPERG